MKPSFVLASKSPRRQELLRQMGFVFEVQTADIPEQPRANETAVAYARRIAEAKARAIPMPAGAVVMGADTDVVLDGRILGKPQDRTDGLRMLSALSERTHEVVSAVAVVQDARCEIAVSVTRVTFGRITPEQASTYWTSGEPIDKAGAYAIQGLGAQFVREIQGSYSGVVGLPLYETCQLLARFGIVPRP